MTSCRSTLQTCALTVHASLPCCIFVMTFPPWFIKPLVCPVYTNSLTCSFSDFDKTWANDASHRCVAAFSELHWLAQRGLCNNWSKQVGIFLTDWSRGRVHHLWHTVVLFFCMLLVFSPHFVLYYFIISIFSGPSLLPNRLLLFIQVPSPCLTFSSLLSSPSLTYPQYILSFLSLSLNPSAPCLSPPLRPPCLSLLPTFFPHLPPLF